MLQSKITLDKDYVIAPVDERIFGSFIEHMGRCVYTGVYEPGHPRADGHGFRTDVLELVRGLNMPVMRYPGGNFVSGYNWRDGVGKDRPRRLDLAWMSTEPNTFGTDEFIAWCRAAGTEPMLAVNLGTAGPKEAGELVEYCNFKKGTRLSDWRRQNGSEQPHDVKIWCLGNEMDGPWQIGHKTAEEYGRIACEAGKIMKWVDPSIELVLCGSSGSGMKTFPQWEATVLEHAYEQADYISLHTYYGNGGNDTPSFLARPVDMDRFIRTVASTCDYVKAKLRAKKDIQLSFDEWNVWSMHSESAEEKWAEHPPIAQDTYTLEDALVVASMMMALLRNADRVKIACLAQLVNIIAPIRTEPNGPAWKQTIYHAFYLISKYARGQALRSLIKTDAYDCKLFDRVPTLDDVAVWNPDRGELSVLMVNRSAQRMEVTLDLRSFGRLTPLEGYRLASDDIKAANTRERPDRVTPETLSSFGDRAVLPGYSFTLLRFKTARAD